MNRPTDHGRVLGWRSMLLCMILLLPDPGGTQTFFEDVTEEAIEKPYVFQQTRDAAFGDYDNDGWPDLFLVEAFGEMVLLHNEEKGWFADRTAAIQADLPLKPKGGGAIFGDYDNDGDLDLLLLIGMFSSKERGGR